MTTYMKLSVKLASIISLLVTVTACAPGGGGVAAVPVAPTLQITSVSPTSSPTAGGATLTVRGILFQSGLSIMIGATFCGSTSFISATEATCLLPAKSSGTYSISITNPDGGSTTLTGGIIYGDVLGPPMVSGVAPTTGSTSGNTAVTISGTQFQTGATVLFDSNSCTSVTVVSANSITCITPAHAAGAVTVTVTNPDAQTNTLSSGYTYVTPPTYTSLKADVLTTRCASCHGSSGGFSTQTYSSIITRVTPGNPSASLLYTRVANDSMPASGGPLTAAQKQKIYDWIMDGAPNN